MTSRQPFFYWEGGTLVLNILGKPSAKQDAIGKPYGHQLKVSVTATPARAEQPTTWCVIWRMRSAWRLATSRLCSAA